VAVKRTSLVDPVADVGTSATGAPAQKTQSKRKANKSPSDDDGESVNRIQVAFRMNRDAYRDLKRMAIDEDTPSTSS
jgi:hypothetical protein